MFEFFSRSAALSAYLAIAGLFLITGVLGVFEHLVYADQLILSTMPVLLAVACLLLGVGYLANVMFKGRWLSRVIGLALIGVGVIGVGSITSGDPQLLASAPMGVILALIFLVGSCFVATNKPAWGKRLWRMTGILAAICAVYIQINVWFAIPPFDEINPVSSSQLTIIVLMAGAALWLKTKFLLVMHEQRPSSEAWVASIVVMGGYCVWFVLSLAALQQLTGLAHQKIQMVSETTVERLEATTQMFRRAQVRWNNILPERQSLFLHNDLEAYSQDYALIEGFAKFSAQHELLYEVGRTDGFLGAGYDKAALTAWLAQSSDEVQRIVSGRSLASGNPLLVFKIPLANGQKVLALVSVKRLVDLNDAYSYAGIHTYLELQPDYLVSLDSERIETINGTDLKAQYPYFVQAEQLVTNTQAMNYFGFLVDFSEVRFAAQLYQLVLWAAIIFCLTLILAADRSKLLRKEKAKLWQLARYDEITGLLRRDTLHELMNTAMSENTLVNNSVLFVDLDGFKPVNDSLGHEVGDAILAIIANRIRKVCPSSCHIARFSSDEFIIFSRILNEAELIELAEKLLAAIREQITAKGFDVHLTASVGLAVYDQETRSQQQLVQYADVAMSEAKNSGGNTYRLFEQRMADNYRNIISVRNRLQVALDQNHLDVHYQPVIDLATGQVVSVESLVRWQLGQEFIPPAVFIPIAERTGQIIQIGEAVVNRVLQHLQTIPQLAAVNVAINVSSQQLKRYKFEDFLKQRLNHYQVPAERLCIELTESDLLDEGANASASLQALSALGCTIAIDDFGTGFSSLSYLHQLPADVVKLDRSFTRDVLIDEKQRKVVEMVVAACKQIGKVVVVEGVEDGDVLDYFRQIGCDRVQGFYFAQPMPIEQLLVYLQQSRDS